MSGIKIRDNESIDNDLREIVLEVEFCKRLEKENIMKNLV